MNDDNMLLRNLSSLRKGLGLLGWLVYQTIPLEHYSCLMWGFTLIPKDMNTAVLYGVVKGYHSEKDCDLQIVQCTDKQIEAFRQAAEAQG